MSAPSFTHDVLIIGQGLAGAVLSETLALQGKRVCVFDRPQAGRSSAVAAGMVNPIVLRRTIPSWRASEMLAIAGAFYRELEMRYDTTFWHPLTLAAIFPTAQEAGIWQLRTKDPEIAPFLERESTADVALESLPRPYGHGVVKRCGWLDVQGFLDQHRARWSKAGDLVETSVAPSDHIPVPGGVRIHERSAPVVVYCEGPFSAYPGIGTYWSPSAAAWVARADFSRRRSLGVSRVTASRGVRSSSTCSAAWPSVGWVRCSRRPIRCTSGTTCACS